MEWSILLPSGTPLLSVRDMYSYVGAEVFEKAPGLWEAVVGFGNFFIFDFVIGLLLDLLDAVSVKAGFGSFWPI